MFPLATVMIAFAVLLAARIRPSGITIVLIGSIAIAALEIGPTLSSPRFQAKVAQMFDSSRVHRS